MKPLGDMKEKILHKYQRYKPGKLIKLRGVACLWIYNLKSGIVEIWRGKPVIGYINPWRALSLDCKDRLTELSIVEMCTQEMH